MEHQEEFFSALEFCRFEEAQKLLPFVNLHHLYRSTTPGGDWLSVLHFAAMTGNLQSLAFLLSVPTIDVHLQSVAGFRALDFALKKRQLECACMLLQDPRVDAALLDKNRETPLYRSAREIDADACMLLIASGKDLVEELVCGWESVDTPYGLCYRPMRALEQAVLSVNKLNQYNFPDDGAESSLTAGMMTKLVVEEYTKNPGRTTAAARTISNDFSLPCPLFPLQTTKPLSPHAVCASKSPRQTTAELFALTIFLCDGLLRIADVGEKLAEERVIGKMPDLNETFLQGRINPESVGESVARWREEDRLLPPKRMRRLY